MLEYFTYKKVKKHREEKKGKEEAATTGGHTSPKPPGDAGSQERRELFEDESGTKRRDSHRRKRLSRSSADRSREAVLDDSDEAFLASILADDGPAPPLPDRFRTPELDWPSDATASETGSIKKKHDTKGKGKVKEEKKPGRLSMLFTKHKKSDTLQPGNQDLTDAEVKREENDLSNVLDRLSLSMKNNKVIPLTADSSELLQKFTQIFKDLANGVPTAYDDLVGLIKDRDGTIAKGFDKLPSGLQKLVMQLPDKITNSLGPEILAAAAKSQGLEASMEGGLKGAAQNMFVPKNLLELMTKPGALVGMLRAIVTALKTRWPAFIGVNVLWSVALFLLMFVLWYCYKRGRETRLEGENGEPVDAGDRIEELPDDPLLPAPEAESSRAAERRSDRGTARDSDRPTSSETRERSEVLM